MSKSLIFITLLLFTGCDFFVFEPKGNHYVELSQEPQKLDINWNQSGDTLGIWDYVTLNYDFEIVPEADPVKVFLFLGDQEVSQVPFGDPITFNSTNLEDGIYQSYLIITATSGTGSLADHLGLETNIVVDSTKHIWVDNGALDQVAITDITLQENGPLKIEWEKYPRPRFNGYEIHEGTYCHTNCIRIKLSSVDSTSWIDYNYDGRDRTYSIWVRDVDIGARSGPEKLFKTSRRPSTFIEAQKGTNEITFTWEKSRYPLPFLSYSISRVMSQSGLHWRAQTLTTIDDINQTEVTVPAALGSEALYFLSIQSESVESETPYHTHRSDTLKVSIGIRFPNNISDIKLLKHDDLNDQYFIYDPSQESIFILDASSMKVLSSNGVGRQNMYAYSAARNQFVVTEANLIKMYDTNSLQLIKTIDLKDLYPSISSPRLSDLSRLLLSDDGTLWYTIATYHSPYTISKGIGALDLDTEILIDSLNFHNDTDRYVSVHPDGHLFFGRIDEKSGYALYKFDGDSVVPVFSPDQSSHTYFAPDGASYYEFTSPDFGVSVINLKSLKDNSLLWSVNIADGISTFAVDKRNNRFSYVSESQGGLVIRSFSDGSVIETIDYAKVSTRNIYTPTNDILWMPTGFYEKLENLR